MGTRRAKSPTAPAKLTNITVRGEGSVRRAARKTGDLTQNDVIGVLEAGSLGGAELVAHSLSPSCSVVPILHEEAPLLHSEPPSTALFRSDVFRFDSVGCSDRQIAPVAPDVSDTGRHAARYMSFDETDGSDDVCSLDDDGALGPSSTSGTAEWCAADQSQEVRVSTTQEVEVLPALTGVASELMTIEAPGGRNEYRTTAALQIIAVAVGALFIFVGIAMVAVALGQTIPSAPRVGGLVAEFSPEDGWGGLALILVGAALEVIGLRSRGTS
jgi:hypothetical protein